jgi:transcriptional regulator of nitric oxide reductase
MRLSHARRVVSVGFDDPNLVSSAGLATVAVIHKGDRVLPAPSEVLRPARICGPGTPSAHRNPASASPARTGRSESRQLPSRSGPISRRDAAEGLVGL